MDIAFGIVVADMAVSLAFYRRLGLDIPATADAEPHVEVALAFGGDEAQRSSTIGSVRLLFDLESTATAIDPSWTPPTGGHRTGLAFGQADPAAVDARYAELTGAGYTGRHAPWDAFWGQRYAVVLDPDGVSIDLYAPLPG